MKILPKGKLQLKGYSQTPFSILTGSEISISFSSSNVVFELHFLLFPCFEETNRVKARPEGIID
jgi:hypothetical protein